MDGKWKSVHKKARNPLIKIQCDMHMDSGEWKVSGKVFTIKPEATPIEAQCNMETDGGGWTVSGKVYIIKFETTPNQVPCDIVTDGGDVRDGHLQTRQVEFNATWRPTVGMDGKWGSVSKVR